MLAVPSAVPLRLLAALLLTAVPAAAQERIDTLANARIREEGLTRSRVLETAIGLSDLQPPRLAGSPGYLRAARWAVARLHALGVPAAGLEPYGAVSPGWELQGFSVEMVAPWYLHLTAYPEAWSPSTRAPLTAPVMIVTAVADSDTVRIKGTLKGKIVLLGARRPLANRERAPLRRLTDADLDSLAGLTDPGEPRSWEADVMPFAEQVKWRRARAEFFRREGVVAVITPGSTEGTLESSGGVGFPLPAAAGVPSFDVARTEYNRLVRLVEAGEAVRLRVALTGREVRTDTLGYNVVAEIPGADPTLKADVVMVGGHLDSWAAGSGATDNAAGCAVAIEALRILRALDLHPRRTVRLALWDAEEPSIDYSGSLGYVQRHFGDPYTGSRLPEHARFSAYFNFDNGSGRIRGINLQGQEEARPIFQALLAPFADLGAAHVSIRNTGSTDHITFVGAGLPGFQFIQDPLDYDSRTHHTALDTGDYLIEDDLKQAAVVLASVLYHVAMRDDLLPRPAAPSNGSGR